MPLRHLLRLLLMLVLELLDPLVVGRLFRQPLVLFVLLPLQLLAFHLLFRHQVVLLLHVFLIQFRVAGVWCGWTFNRREVFCVKRRASCRAEIGSIHPNGAIGRGTVGRSSLARFQDAVIFECSRTRSRGDSGLAKIHRSAQLWIAARDLRVLQLSRDRWNMAAAFGDFFLRRGTRVYPAITAVEADAIHVNVGDSLVVHVAGEVKVDVAYGAIVEEAAIVPASSHKSDAEIAKAVIDPAVEANLRAPVTLVPEEGITTPAPITRGPG